LVIESRRAELEILFRNLIDNAVKYGGTPPRVVVRAFPEGARAIVKVSDNGSGIPPNMRRKIFGRFVRLGNELERSKPGTGLGLYLVRSVTRSLGGSIRIENRDVVSQGFAEESAFDTCGRHGGSTSAGNGDNKSDQSSVPGLGCETGTVFSVSLPGLSRRQVLKSAESPNKVG
jgi:signal transduction histidine kinase